jgi:NIPSNAP
VNKHGGTHHGYFLPGEGASDQALALFSFPSFADYETFRTLFGVDRKFVAADQIRTDSGRVVRHDRSFMRPFSARQNWTDDRPRELRLPSPAEPS